VASLRDLQTGFRLALLDDADHRVAEAIVPDRLGAPARLAIYRHHVLTSLTTALEAAFPVVCRLVDRRFFGWLADRFIRAHPPTGPCLVEYGGDLPAFIDAFPACASLPWLGDVARLEWAMIAVVHAPDSPALTPEMLAAIAPAAVATRVLRLHPAVRLLASRWPVDTIWRANQPEAAALVVDLDAGGVELEIRRDGDDVVFRRLPPGMFALRDALAAGHSLGAAVEAALAIDPAFDVAAAIRALLDERVIAAG
jgi:hypothetical protein